MKKNQRHFLSITVFLSMLFASAFIVNVYPCIDAKFYWEPYEPLVNDTVTFNASISSCNWNGTTNTSIPIMSYEWNFGDGTHGEGEVITHNFTDEGTFEVTLVITDAGGDPSNDTFSIPLTVKAHSNSNGNGEELPWWIQVILPLVVGTFVIVVASAVYVRHKKSK